MTLRLLAGVAAPDRGRIVLNGKILFDSDRRINLSSAQRRIGVVFQDYARFPHMTVAENVAFVLQQLPKEEQRVRVRRQLEQMHISDLAARYPGEISGGQRQRVALARCMAIEPDALLLSSMTEQIVTSSKKQETATEEVQSSVQKIAGLVQQTFDSTMATDCACQILTQLSSTLQSALAKFQI